MFHLVEVCRVEFPYMVRVRAIEESTNRGKGDVHRDTPYRGGDEAVSWYGLELIRNSPSESGRIKFIELPHNFLNVKPRVMRNPLEFLPLKQLVDVSHCM